jgi:hypothetical protein
VRERVRRKSGADLPLPRERGAPEQEARALLRRPEPSAGGARGYDERSFASAISDAMVAGKSAVINGPISFA